MKNKKERILVVVTIVILSIIAIFSILNWDIIVYLFSHMINGVEIVKEYILSLGIIGFISMTLIIIICFFFPFISSIPVQLASAVSYGLLGGFVHVTLSIFLASQLTFLFTKNANIFSSQKKKEQHIQLEEKIKNSNRSIVYFMVLAYLAPFVPFLIIHMIAASSGMKWWKYSLLTLLGSIPDILVTLWAGVKITTSSSPIVSFVLLMIIIACVVLSMVYKNKIIDIIFTPKKEKKDGEQE